MTQRVPKSVLDLAGPERDRPGYQTIEILLQPSFHPWFSIRLRLDRGYESRRGICDITTWIGTPREVPVLGLQPVRNIRAALEFRRLIREADLKTASTYIRESFDISPKELMHAARGTSDRDEYNLVSLLAHPGHQVHCTFALPDVTQLAKSPPCLDNASGGPYPETAFAILDGIGARFAWNTTGWGIGSAHLNLAQSENGRELVATLLRSAGSEELPEPFDTLTAASLEYVA